MMPLSTPTTTTRPTHHYRPATMPLDNQPTAPAGPRKRSAAYRVFRLRLTLVCAAFAGLFIAGIVWKAVSDFQSARSGTIAQTRNLVQAIEAHVVDSIESLDAPLLSTSAALARLAGSGSFGRSDIQRLLSTPLLPPTASYWVMFIDRDGLGVAASNGLDVAGVSYADRLYFKTQSRTLQGGARPSLYVGSPDVGRVSKKKSFFVSRRVESAQGAFLGVIVAIVDPASIARVLRLSQYQDNLSITMLNTDGRIIARVPLHEESFARDISKSELFAQLAKSPQGVYEAVSFIDGEKRVYSYRSLHSYPLVVTVGISTPTMGSIFARDLFQIVLGSISLLLVVALGGAFALRSFRELEEAGERQKALNRELEEAKDSVDTSERRARMIADNMPALVSYVDSDQKFRFRNSYYKSIPGIDYDSMIGRTMQEIFGAQSHSLIASEVEKALRGEPSTFERERPGPDGLPRSLRHQYSPDVQPDGSVAGFYALVADVTDMKAVQHQLMALARIDSLTGLPNRAFLYERMEQAIARSARHNFDNAKPSRLGCLFLDIDHFKDINDSFGHAGGDAVLKEFGARLTHCVRQTDMVARLAGDEFVILLEGLEQPRGAEVVAAKILASMSRPFVVDQSSIAVTTSIGVAVFSDSAGGSDLLLRQADAALYHAKRNGRNGFSLGSPGELSPPAK